MHFSLRQVHVFLPRRLFPKHNLPGSAPARNTLYLPRTTPRRPLGAQLGTPTPRRRRRRGVGARNCAQLHPRLVIVDDEAWVRATAPTPRRRCPRFFDSNFKNEKKNPYFSASLDPVNRFQLIILLIVQYKYLKSFSKDFIVKNLILRTRLLGTNFITQPS